jgi:hypothetical protein
MPTNQRLGANRSVFAYSGLFQMSSDECFGLHEPPSDSIFLTRNQQDFRDAAGIQPVHTDKQKNAPPQTRHVLQQVKCKSELARPINQLLLFRDRCDIGMLTASENIGQLECVIVLINSDFLPPWPQRQASGSTGASRETNAKLPAACHFVIQDGEQMLQKTGVSLFFPARIAIPP